MARKAVRARTRRERAANHAAAAEQFFDAGAIARDLEYWNAAGLLYVHSAIAYSDAVSIHLAEWKSTSSNHMDAVALLTEVAAGKAGRDRAVKHLRDILMEKNRVSYEGDLVRREDAAKLELQAGRFRAWCRTLLGASSS